QSAPRDKDTPRLVVFGTAGWITDGGLSDQPEGLLLFGACTSWLRNRSNVPLFVKIPDKKREPDKLNIGAEKENRVICVPSGLMVLGVIGLGTCVWVVRRR